MEYACLDPAFINMSDEDYIKQRQAVYRDLSQPGPCPRQSVERIAHKKVEENSADIQVVKREDQGQSTRRYLDDYHLEKKDGSWIITRVRSRPYQGAT